MGYVKDKRKRYSLVFATVVAFCSVCTAGVSTFAWFQANAQVSINTGTTNTTINVSAPPSITVEEPTLYEFNGNRSHGYRGDTPDHSFAIGDDDDEYTEVETASISISRLWPGYKATFCIVTSTTNGTDIRNGSLKLVSYTPTNKSTRKVLNEDKNGLSGNNIQIEYAINIYVGINGTGDFSVGSDAFNFAGSSLANTYLAQDETVEEDTIYCFYTIEFSSNPGTFYTEYIYEDSTYKAASEAQPDVVDASPNNRFFAKDETSGNSSCYEGLAFVVSSLSLEMV